MSSCVLVIFGASGDLTKRLLLPSLLHLASDGLLSDAFAVLGVAREQVDDETFRERMTNAVATFSPRKSVDSDAWGPLRSRLFYMRGGYDDPETFQRLKMRLAELDQRLGTGGNALFYLATPPSLFATVSRGLREAGLTEAPGAWRRVIIEKPFGHDLGSAIALGKEILTYWREEQVFRIDHYLGKETVQNLLAFRFANGIFEPLWNRHHVDHIQFTAAEAVGVEGRGRYYENAGVLRDMLQNHVFQMLAYLCMEAPGSLAADDVRDEKAKLLRAVRIMTPADVARNAVRGQYGPGRGPDGNPVPGYRNETGVAAESATETFAALRLFIDNWRWEGVPIYVRSGKRLWKKGTEIVVQFRATPEAARRGASGATTPNRLIFHIQPDQGIELRMLAKCPGPVLSLQDVSLRFAWTDTFRAARSTGYEVLLHHAMIGDGTLFSRTDLVEAAWRAAQPVLDAWTGERPSEFPNYAAGTWGPKAAHDLLLKDGRRWIEVPNREILARIPLFAGGDEGLLSLVATALRPAVVGPGEVVVRRGDPAHEMYLLCRGEADVIGEAGNTIATLRDGDYFGEVALILARDRTATVRTRSDCDLLVLERRDFERVVSEHDRVAEALLATARARYEQLGKG